MKGVGSSSAGLSSQDAVSVVVADDHPIVRQGIRDELERHEDIAVVGEAVDGNQALELCLSLRPDLLLLDIGMPGLRAVEVVKELNRTDGAPRVLVLSAYGDLEYVLALLKAGASGYMLKDEDPATICEGVRAVARGQTWMSSTVVRSLVGIVAGESDQSAMIPLSARETQVLGLLARGMKNEDIAEAMSIAVGTVKNHVTAIYGKLGVQSRAEAVAWAWRRGVVKDLELP